MREPSLDDSFSRHADVVFCELHEEAVILHLGTGQYYGLNKVGTRMWQLISEQRPLRDVLEDLEREYDAPTDRLQADLIALAAGLSEARLLVPRL